MDAHTSHDCWLSLQEKMNNLNIIGPDPLDENLDEKDIEIADSNTLLSISNQPNINKLSNDLIHATVQIDR